jgi:uncharacterized membrane protein
MSLLIFIVVSAVVFGIGDALMLSLVMQPLFKSALGDQMLDKIRVAPAVGFYVIHMAGLAWFAGLAVTRGGTAGIALLNGAILGFVAFACYEMTSYTIMRSWNLRMVITDIAWGTFISGLSAWAGALAVIRFMRG